MNPQIKKNMTWLLVILCLSSFSIAQNPNWVVYSPDNSNIPSNYVLSLAMGSDGTIWVGGESSNISSFDSGVWTTFNMASGEIISLDVDLQNNLWIGSDNGPLTKYDGVDFTEFLPESNARWISIDDNSDVWAANFQGLSKYDGTSWTQYDTSNSEIPFPSVFAVSATNDGNIWEW